MKQRDSGLIPAAPSKEGTGSIFESKKVLQAALLDGKCTNKQRVQRGSRRVKHTGARKLQVPSDVKRMSYIGVRKGAYSCRLLDVKNGCGGFKLIVDAAERRAMEL